MEKNVLVLTNDINGLHNFRKEVVKAIVGEGFNVVISMPENSDKSEFFRGIGCEINLVDFNRRGVNPFADFKLMVAYWKLMRRLKPVAVLTYTIKPNIYGGMAARLCGVPQLANITGLGDAVENGGLLQKLTTLLYKFGVSKAHKVFFQNESNRNFCIRSKIVGDNSVLLPGSGVNLQYHAFQDYPKDDGIIRFLFIGRFQKDKGAEEYLETAKAIKERYPQTEFQIVGTIDEYYKIKVEELESIGAVRFWGRQFDVRPFIGAVECTIMPSYHEGMSNVNLESAANGRPVITTNVPGCKETVDDGKTGYLVEARNARSLISSVERFLSLPYEQKKVMGLQGRRKVEREFDREIVIKAYLEQLKVI